METMTYDEAKQWFREQMSTPLLEPRYDHDRRLAACDAAIDAITEEAVRRVGLGRRAVAHWPCRVCGLFSGHDPMCPEQDRDPL